MNDYCLCVREKNLPIVSIASLQRSGTNQLTIAPTIKVVKDVIGSLKTIASD